MRCHGLMPTGPPQNTITPWLAGTKTQHPHGGGRKGRLPPTLGPRFETMTAHHGATGRQLPFAVRGQEVGVVGMVP